MKKIALTLLSLFLITPCLANIHIKTSTVESVVKEFVPADKVVSVISEYKNQIEQSNGTGISAQKLWDICVIAGWDIKQSSGKSKCREFVYALVSRSSIKFYHACAKENKGEPGYICVDDFFTRTQVNLTPGQTLAKEYARLKHNDSVVQCNSEFDSDFFDDTLMCTSHNKNAYYEFVFDDLEEPKDQTIKNSIQSAICRMYDAKPTTAGCAGGGTNVSGTITCWSAFCEADSAKCKKIDQSMAKFGYSAIYKDKKCEINFNSINDKSKLKTAYGINNFVFCHGIQVANTPDVETYLKQYVAQRAGVSVSKVKCDSGFNTYTGTGCTRNGITDLKDDIKTCRVGKNQIDFVFDDINEKWKKTVEGGVQGMSCIVTGGTYSGQRCVGLGKKQCEVLSQSNLKECPECKAAKWDDETQSCILPSSKSAQNLQKGVNIGLIVGGAVVGVALTVVTAGAAGAPVTAIVLTGIETVGAGIELTSQLKINGIADDFLVESNKCKDAPCAKKMLSQNLQRMANYANDMTAAEADAVDTEMARLANLIPDDDEIWATMLVNGTDMADNKLGFFDTDSWEPGQVWRAVGIGLQLTSLIAGITKWAISKSSRITKSTAAIKQKFANAIKSIDNTPESVLRDKRLELKQLAKNGKKVSNADGAIVVPKGQMAAGIRKADGTVTITAKSKYKFVNALDNATTSELGKSLNVGFLGDDMVYHMDGLTDPQLARMKEILSDHNIPYYEHTTGGILFYEKDIVRFGTEIDPTLTRKLQDILDFEKRALDNGDMTEGIIKTSQKTILAFKDNIYQEDLLHIADTKRNKILNIVAEDSELTQIALNFDTATLDEKQRFAQKILNNLEGGNITAEVKISHSAVGEQDKARIIFGLNHKENGSLDGFITTLSHEHNHYINQYKPKDGALADLPEEILDRTVTNEELFNKYFPDADYDWYYINSLDEQSSYFIGDYVGQDFENDLIDLIRSRL